MYFLILLLVHQYIFFNPIHCKRFSKYHSWKINHSLTNVIVINMLLLWKYKSKESVMEQKFLKTVRGQLKSFLSRSTRKISLKSSCCQEGRRIQKLKHCLRAAAFQAAQTLSLAQKQKPEDVLGAPSCTEGILRGTASLRAAGYPGMRQTATCITSYYHLTQEQIHTS